MSINLRLLPARELKDSFLPECPECSAAGSILFCLQQIWGEKWAKY